jgi:hypothetical protein
VTTEPARIDRRALWVTVIVAGLLAVALPVALARHYGALGIPRSDDWSYLVTLFRLDGSGTLSFNHWVSMSLVGQLVPAWAVVGVMGRDVGALQVLTAVEGLAGLVFVGLATQRCVRAPWAGLLLVVTIAAGPLWGPLAVSFMTDVPAFALSALAMLLAIEGLRRRPAAMGWLAASVIAALGAFTVRQYALVGLVAVAVAGAWTYASESDRRRAARLLVLAAVGVLLAVAFLAWWRTVPDGRSLSPGLPTLHSARVVAVKGTGFLRLLGLLLLPVTAYAAPVRLVRRSWRASRVLTVVAGAGSALALVGSAWRVPRDLFVGNYVTADGVLSDIVVTGRRPDVLPAPAWDALVVLASLAAVVLVVAAVPVVVLAARRVRARDWRVPDPIDAYLALLVLGYGAAYAFAAATGLQVYDRYALPVLPAVGLALLRARERPAPDAPASGEPGASMRRGAAGIVAVAVALVLLAVVGFAFTADSASFDGARWRAAEAATRRGWAVDQVNGGFEWVNYHRGDKVEAGRRDPHGTPLCVTVQVDPRRIRTRVVAVVHSDAPTRASVPVIALRTPRPCRPRNRLTP